MREIKQVRLVGFGGQGIILAGVLLGQAGVIEGKHIAGSDSYGAQARGSGCKAEVIFSNGPIDFPHLTTADILIAMSQQAYNTYCGDIRETSGLILYDQGLVNPREDLKLRQVNVPATEYALKKLRNKQVANIVLLGALMETTKIVLPKSMKKAIIMHVSERFQSLNLEALRLGIGLGRPING
jgi:2-oxoglutarate ferredoxin oxidoreductase subunit gamma